MPKYVIERTLPGAGELSADDLRAISQKSVSVLMDLGPELTWYHSYVAGDKIICVYQAPNEDLVREHARCGGFPVDSVVPVSAIIDPDTAER